MKPDYDVGIVGAGFAGLIAALQLKKKGKISFVVFERAAAVGGTWRDNIYPGCACDISSHLYSIASMPNYDWSNYFSKQPEILNYLKAIVVKNDLAEYIRFNTDITEAKFMEAYGCWKVTDRNGNDTTVQVLLLAVGPLNRPNLPSFKGLETFKGKAFHSSQWDYSVDLKNKNVAVIGTGASAIQFIPEIAPEVAHLTVFQRTAAWVLKRGDWQMSSFIKKLFRRFPFLQKLLREQIYWLHEFLGFLFLGNKLLNKIVVRIALKKLKKDVADPETRKKLTPDYKIGCKRILNSDDFYTTFNRPNVSLVTEGIEQVTADSIVTKDGKSHPADVLIFATGFKAADIEIYTKITGINNRNLIDEWRANGAEAYLGTTISGYPNLAYMLGPNTGLGHTSVLHIMESQMNYILQYIALLQKEGYGSYLDVKPLVQKEYNERIEARLKGTVWASGCRSWYMNVNGKNTAIYPGLTVRFRKKTKKLNVQDYFIIHRPVSKLGQRR